VTLEEAKDLARQASTCFEIADRKYLAYSRYTADDSRPYYMQAFRLRQMVEDAGFETETSRDGTVTVKPKHS
jgi:hypothetical protein